MSKPVSYQRLQLITKARQDAIVNGNLSKSGLQLVNKLMTVMPSRILHALDACYDDPQYAEALLLEHERLSDSTFATNALLHKRKVDKRMVDLRRQHRMRLEHVRELGSRLLQALAQSEDSFASEVQALAQSEGSFASETREVLSFVVNSALISRVLDAEVVGWGRFVNELDADGGDGWEADITARHRALASPQSFFDDLHAQETWEAAELWTAAGGGHLAVAITQLAPKLRPHLRELGLALPDVLGILKTACHNEWDEVGQLVADPRLLVRQAAAVK